MREVHLTELFRGKGCRGKDRQASWRGSLQQSGSETMLPSPSEKEAADGDSCVVPRSETEISTLSSCTEASGLLLGTVLVPFVKRAGTRGSWMQHSWINTNLSQRGVSLLNSLNHQRLGGEVVRQFMKYSLHVYYAAIKSGADQVLGVTQQNIRVELRQKLTESKIVHHKHRCVKT